MKKKVWKMLPIAIIGVVMVVVSLSTVVSDKERQISDLLLENIEALAAGEEGPTAFCYGKGDVVCPNGTHVKHIQYLR